MPKTMLGSVRSGTRGRKDGRIHVLVIHVLVIVVLDSDKRGGV